MTDAAATIAAPLIAQFEGWRALPYPDSGGVMTIGYGFTYLADGSKVTAHTPAMTKAEGLTLLTSIVAKTVVRVRQLVYAQANDNQIAAFTSFAYNVGTSAFGRSTLLKLFNNKAPTTSVAVQFGAWVYDNAGNKEAGLVTRRAEEKALFLQPSLTPPPPPELTADDLNAAELDGNVI